MTLVACASWGALANRSIQKHGIGTMSTSEKCNVLSSTHSGRSWFFVVDFPLLMFYLGKPRLVLSLSRRSQVRLRLNLGQQLCRSLALSLQSLTLILEKYVTVSTPFFWLSSLYIFPGTKRKKCRRRSCAQASMAFYRSHYLSRSQAIP